MLFAGSSRRSPCQRQESGQVYAESRSEKLPSVGMRMLNRVECD
ncbi:hypothetical protein JI435_414060 [Parastagonospora nodorum SN15]|uniref:Uncharacterized protein n=1 Tax=Phaeosphaeria nodorum (strain SN15 / ATCC MYA-4574 / FGSC 10173) TaxID=321614 RepID=A0A7U2FBC1_PHANO|nr:hypothetical protein JI435_414060 [Parastagonospora nodorum SN15]